MDVKAFNVLLVLLLALEHAQILCQHLPIEFFSNELLSVVLVILGLSVVVDIAVKSIEEVPLLNIRAQMVDILLTNVKEILSTCKIVQHDCSPCLVEQLLLEKLGLIHKLLKGCCLLWKHVGLSLGKVVSDLVNFLNNGWVLDLPRFIVLLLEKLDLLCI